MVARKHVWHKTCRRTAAFSNLQSPAYRQHGCNTTCLVGLRKSPANSRYRATFSFLNEVQMSGVHAVRRSPGLPAVPRGCFAHGRTRPTTCSALPTGTAYVTTAFEQLLRRYEPLAFRTCRYYLHDELSAAIGQGLNATRTRLYRAEQPERAYGKIVKDSEN